MKRLRSILPLIILSLLLLIAHSCVERGEVDDVSRRVDSINTLAYNARYRSIDNTKSFAREAIAMSDEYGDGYSEAQCWLGYSYFMSMDYDSARLCFDEVIGTSGNELLKLVADVGMMKVCQRVADNKAYYDYRNSSLSRMERIDYEAKDMNARQVKLWNFARSEFSLVSSTYYYYMRQEEQAVEEINALRDNFDILIGDSAQLAYYCYMVGSGGLTVDGTAEEIEQLEESLLVKALSVSRAKGYKFFEADAIQCLAYNFIHSGTFRPSRMAYVKELIDADTISNDTLLLYMAQKALKLFREYGSLYNLSDAYLTISDYYLAQGNNEVALDTACKALECINIHHILTTGKADTCMLKPFERMSDTLSIEQRWMDDPNSNCVPEWMAAVREQLCIIFSALGMKQESDYNRNIYLDIMDVTRQDREMEQRYETLQSENKQVNMMLTSVIVLMLVLVVSIIYFSRALKKRDLRQTEKLKRALLICQKITGSMPSDAEDESDIREALHGAVDDDVKALIKGVGSNWADVDVDTLRLGSYERELLSVIRVFFQWTVTRGLFLVTMSDRRRRVESERYLHEKHLEENKRDYVDKLTSISIVYGITPFLDRAVHEIDKWKSSAAKGDDSQRTSWSLSYLRELIDKINDYNEVLSHWIKIRQGVVSLNVENFSLSPLFDTLSKSRNSFDNKHISLTVNNSDAVVKADKALTLFMMNTLLENARKYTPEGGDVTLSAEDTGDYVEISVTDTGRGISAADVDMILGEKVYDSSTIGNPQDDEDLKKNKGFGFGLINCKGIIEKYRKTNSIFSVCKFGIESEVGKGSRFYFRLPKGVLKAIYTISIIILAIGLGSCRHAVYSSADDFNQNISKLREDSLIRQANYYVDMVYYCNVDSFYRDALLYADSAIMSLNSYYIKTTSNDSLLLSIGDEGARHEIDWWNKGVYSDFDLILTLRNEVAISALAINDWKLYRYNNDIYSRLYKLMAQDVQIEMYCDSTHEVNVMEQTIIIIIVLLILLGLIAYYMLYYRHNMLSTFNMRQIIEFNSTLFDTANEDLLRTIHDGVSDIRLADGVALMSMSGEVHVTDGCPYEEYLCQQMRDVLSDAREKVSADGILRSLPLEVHTDEGAISVGVLGIVMHNSSITSDDRLSLQLIAQYIAIHIYYTSIQPESQLHDIEMLEDDMARTEYEENSIHVHNMVLDNCLSTIKHETMYYPNRIRQIAESTSPESPDFDERMSQINDIVHYYKDIFTLLSDCAARQLESVMFKRKTIQVDDLSKYARKRFDRMRKKSGIDMQMDISPSNDYKIRGDIQMLQYMIDNLLMMSFEDKKSRLLSLDFDKSERFIKFAYSDEGITIDDSRLSQLFYADNMVMDMTEGRLHGAQLLICKQIIRQHDDYAGLRGCRIYAERLNENGGLKIIFTLPKAP